MAGMSAGEVADLLRAVDAEWRAVEARLAAIVEHVEATGCTSQRVIVR
jgi:hypothetical protein